MADTKQNFWYDLYESESKGKAKADFTVGWLCSCLRNTGMSQEEIEKNVAEGRAEADKHFK